MNIFQVIKKSIITVWRYERRWFFINILYTIIAGIIPVLTIWIGKELINTLSLVLIKEQNKINLVFILLIAQLFISFLSISLTKYINYMNTKIVFNLDKHLNLMIFKKVSESPYIYFEIPEFHNDLKRINSTLGERFLSPLRNVFELLKNSISIVSLVIFLANIHILFLVLCFATSIPTIIVYSKLGNARYKLMYNQTPFTRDLFYTSRLLTEKDSVKEIKIFGIHNYLVNRWTNIFYKNRNESLKLTKKENYSNVALEGIRGTIFFLSSLLLIKLIQKNKLTLGDFVAVTQGILTTITSVTTCSTSLALLYEDSIYLNKLFDFLEFDKKDISQNTNYMEQHSDEVCKSILKVENLHFKYPGTDNKYALDNISFNIKQGEKIALVGENGSGKTTLVKCLLGLYPLSKGDILVNCKNIKNISKDELYNKFTVLFQDFMKYSFTAKENIAFGEISLINNQEAIESAARESGIDKTIKDLNEGYETYLTRILYDGTDLSGGQWQKIALSRAFLRNSDIVILDEPTSALDPKSELEIFEKILRISNNKTAIFISHRLAVTKFVDRIIVLKNGCIIEEGTFSELMSYKNAFYSMYKAQSKYYEEEKIFSEL
jgi:ATP-binding cassette, subfamily B, bacterial